MLGEAWEAKYSIGGGQEAADGWEAKYKVSDGVRRLAEEWEVNHKANDEAGG
jgi:hypothetical protein